jgi:membrane protein YdbS with pleckstrin-like domain/phage FluMu protein Com
VGARAQCRRDTLTPMIRLTCDNCSKPIDVEDTMAGQKIKCPACGDVNVIPVAGTKTGTPRIDRAAEAGYPPADGPEAPVLTVRRAMFRAKPVRFLALVLGLLAGLAGAVYFMAFAPTSNPALAAVFAVIGVACFLILAVWKFTTIGEVMEISNKRTLEKTGILSKHTNEVMHRDIRNIQIMQTFRERIFNVGKIVISSAAEEDSEIVAVDIPDPKKLRDVIDLYRQV